MDKSVSAIIVAAGSSARMGTPKALLTIDGTIFAEKIAREIAAASIDDVVIVLGAEHERIRQAIGSHAGRIVINTAWETGRLSSIVAGIAALDAARCAGALIWPVDHPLVSSAVVHKMVKAFAAEPSKIIIPACGGKRGHPIILPRTLFEEARRAPADIGLRAVVRAHPDSINEIETDDDGILINIDTPEEYRLHCVHKNEDRGNHGDSIDA